VAIETLITTSPYSGSNADLTTLEECAALLKETGHPASPSTLRRWIAKHGIPTAKVRGKVFVSFTAILMVHRDEVARRD
jgi:hypothetical protein